MQFDDANLRMILEMFSIVKAMESILRMQAATLQIALKGLVRIADHQRHLSLLVVTIKLDLSPVERVEVTPTFPSSKLLMFAQLIEVFATLDDIKLFAG